VAQWAGILVLERGFFKRPTFPPFLVAVLERLSRCPARSQSSGVLPRILCSGACAHPLAPDSPMLVLSPNHCTTLPAWMLRRCPHWQIASTDKP
jgi:hypothetical protein